MFALMDAAVHEAGHAVVYFHFGAPLSRLKVDERGNGWCTPARVLGDPHARLAFYAAGECAHLHWLRDTGQWTAERARMAFAVGQVDRQKANVVARAYLGGPLRFAGDAADPGDYASAEVVAGWVLTERWVQVVALAEVLAARRSLSGEEALRAASRCGPAFEVVTVEDEARMRRDELSAIRKRLYAVKAVA